MKRLIYVVVAVVGLSFAAFGCDTNKGKSLAPVAPATARVLPADAQMVVMQAWVERWTGPDGVNRIVKVARADVNGPAPGEGYALETFAAYVTLESGRNGPHLQRVLCVCDYPTGFMGPLPCGHCYEDGSGCSPCPTTDPGMAAAHFFIDPAAPAPVSSGDPTGDDSNADNDGVLLK